MGENKVVNMKPKKSLDDKFRLLEENIFTFEDLKGKEVIVKYRQDIPIADKVAIINEVVNNTFENGIYNPVSEELTRNALIVEFFTDYETPEDANDMMLLFNHTDLIHELEANVPHKVLYSLNMDITSAINHEKRIIENQRAIIIESKLDDVLDAIKDYIEVMGEKMQVIDFNKMENNVEGLSKAFSGLDSKEIVSRIATAVREENKKN